MIEVDGRHGGDPIGSITDDKRSSYSQRIGTSRLYSYEIGTIESGFFTEPPGSETNFLVQGIGFRAKTFRISCRHSLLRYTDSVVDLYEPLCQIIAHGKEDRRAVSVGVDFAFGFSGCCKRTGDEKRLMVPLCTKRNR